MADPVGRVTITDYRISALLDTSDWNVKTLPIVHGIQAHVQGRGWIDLGTRDGRRLTFKTPQEAEAEAARLRDALAREQDGRAGR